ncbi:Hypothetical protein BSSP2_I0177 [Brucella suis bv. 2]|nr:hypothetical protein BCA52141_I1406 [Brucella canis HSK A52141]AIB16913.1 Hypothetical protein BSSP3_I0177 [Brucella suis bv. 2]AIB20289.1 Hypothetical protein BSPT1_I0179 [Brucella suis bv. 2]AIB23660.1 Hypothetical protein BSPT2_I0180 [Brucella suis bv. 2]AIB27050.1 Hypothetical protein BSSP1_I0177 [Brucella suis bv. 2]
MAAIIHCAGGIYKKRACAPKWRRASLFHKASLCGIFIPLERRNIFPIIFVEFIGVYP